MFSSEFRESLCRYLPTIEDHLRLTHGFVLSLLSESDREFVVKLSIFFENLSSVAIISRFYLIHGDGLESIVTQLPYGDPRFGKVAFLESLKIIEKSDARFLKALSEFRNNVAHSVGHLGFNFQDYIVRLGDDQANSFLDRFTASNAYLCQEGIFGHPIDRRLALEHPKEFILCGAVDVMHCFDVAALSLRNFGHVAREHVEELFARLTRFEVPPPSDEGDEPRS